jgi:hypothetical protein
MCVDVNFYYYYFLGLDVGMNTGFHSFNSIPPEHDASVSGNMRDMLWTYFTRWGQVLEVFIHGGVGFVTMADHSIVETILRLIYHPVFPDGGLIVEARQLFISIDEFFEVKNNLRRC